jgi:hypothetical protein
MFTSVAFLFDDKKKTAAHGGLGNTRAEKQAKIKLMRK